MLKYNELFQANAQIPDEWYEVVKEEVIGVIDKNLTARQFFEVEQVPADTEVYSYDRFSDISAAALISKGGEISRDVVATSRASFDVPIIAKGYYIHRIDAMRQQYVNLSVRRAARKVAEALDELLYLGTIGGIAAPTIVGIDGASTAVTGTPTGGWDTATALQIYDDVNLMLLDLESYGTAGQRPQLILNAAQYGEMRKLNSSTDSSAFELVRDGLGVDIHRAFAPGVVDGTAYMIGDSGRDIMTIVVAEDVTTERAVYDLPRQSFLANIYARLFPMIFQYGSASNKSEYVIKMTTL